MIERKTCPKSSLLKVNTMSLIVFKFTTTYWTYLNKFLTTIKKKKHGLNKKNQYNILF